MNRASGRAARRRASQVLRVAGAVILAVGACRCTIDRAHGEPPTSAGADGAAGAAGGGQRRTTEPFASDDLEGLTRSQVKARRGVPTAVRGAAWIYTPEQPGCREVIISEVVTFKRGVVASVQLERKQTGKVCARRPEGTLER